MKNCKCLQCSNSYHYCGSCGEDSFAEMGFCSSQCFDNHLDAVPTEALSKLLAEAVYRYTLTDKVNKLIEERRQEVAIALLDFYLA